jgi:hypothetical protein
MCEVLLHFGAVIASWIYIFLCNFLLKSHKRRYCSTPRVRITISIERKVRQSLGVCKIRVSLVSHPCPWGVVAAVGEATLLGFRVNYPMFMTMFLANCCYVSFMLRKRHKKIVYVVEYLLQCHTHLYPPENCCHE